MIAEMGLAFLAGVLSVLSPCVLPVLPLVLGAANTEHRWGPAALALGLAISFVVIGLFFATVGFSLGLDNTLVRSAAAILLVATGLVLIVPAFGARLASAAGSLSAWTDARYGGFSTKGFGGQFGLGLLLGAVWSPCVGPTLGAASVLAAQGRNLGQVTTTMLAFGLGAGLPLALLGLLSRDILMRWRRRMSAAGAGLKLVLGCALAASGLLILTGADRTVETILVNASPAWVTDLTTQF